MKIEPLDYEGANGDEKPVESDKLQHPEEGKGSAESGTLKERGLKEIGRGSSVRSYRQDGSKYSIWR